MEEVNWENMTWTEAKGEPSVQIEYAYVDGRFQKKFVYNRTTFPNLRAAHGENCDCDYCDPFAPIIPSPPLPGVEEMLVMNIDKTWDLKPRTNQLGDEIDYVELAPPTEAEITELNKSGYLRDYAVGARQKCNKGEANARSVGTKQCAPPFGVSTISILTSIDYWENAQKDFLHQESVAAQKDLEEYVGVDSTSDYQDLNELKGIVACYVYVGNCLNENCPWVIEEYKKAWEPILTKIPEDWEVIWVTTKDGDSRIEMLRF